MDAGNRKNSGEKQKSKKQECLVKKNKPKKGKTNTEKIKLIRIKK
jgi:hypothetical protein